MTLDFAENVVKLLKEERERKVEGLVSGQLTLEKYQYHCGEIHGLDLAVDQIQAVLKKLEDPDDE